MVGGGAGITWQEEGNLLRWGLARLQIFSSVAGGILGVIMAPIK